MFKNKYFEIQYVSEFYLKKWLNYYNNAQTMYY